MLGEIEVRPIFFKVIWQPLLATLSIVFAFEPIASLIAICQEKENISVQI
jgi:hypothetical protein